MRSSNFSLKNPFHLLKSVNHGISYLLNDVGKKKKEHKRGKKNFNYFFDT